MRYHRFAGLGTKPSVNSFAVTGTGFQRGSIPNDLVNPNNMPGNPRIEKRNRCRADGGSWIESYGVDPLCAQKLVVQQEQFNNGCHPIAPAGSRCPQEMTTWWTVRADSSTGQIVHADKDEGKARTWASQFEAQAGPKGDKNDLMPEPTAIDMPAPGRDIDQGPAVSKDGTILGMKPQTALLGAAAVVALIMISKG